MCLFKYFTSFLSMPPPHPLPHFESVSFTIFSSPGPLSRSILFSLFWGWRYYVIVRGIEHKSRGSSGPMNYWWESQRDPPRSAHFTSSSPHSRVNQAKWREGEEGERERGREEEEESIVWMEDRVRPWLRLNYGWQENDGQIGVESTNCYSHGLFRVMCM